MYLSKFSISNQKCFKDHAELTLSQGINLVVGKNNSGKTALLEALSLTAQPVPHRSLHDGTEVTGPSAPGSGGCSLAITARDLLNIPISGVGPPLGYPVIALPDPTPEFAASIGYVDESLGSLKRFSDWLRAASLQVRASFTGGQTITEAVLESPSGYSSIGAQKFADLRAMLAGNPAGVVGIPPVQQQVTGQFATMLKSKIRLVPAARGSALLPQIGQRMERIDPSGTNLVGVLDYLQRNPGRMDRFVRLVSRTLPDLKHLSVRVSSSSNNGEIAVWSFGSETEREEIPPALENCGTGVRHILILLLQAFFEQGELIIIIDELEHSLHPGAIRELLDIFDTDFSKHQFIIGTHSTSAIASSRATSVHLVTKASGASVVQSIDREKLQYRKLLLAEIGSTVSDVFGADTVLWVEGVTEEICFPRILNCLAAPGDRGAVVMKGLIHTGDLNRKKDPELVFQIYKKLSAADALFPTEVAFVIDRDGRSQGEMDELNRRSGNRVRFTERRMFENYLLKTEAIAAVLSQIDPGHPISRESVHMWLDQHHADNKYGAQAAGDRWEIEIHGADLLKDLFWELSNNTIAFEKTSHTVAICEWLVENDRDSLLAIVTLINEARKAASDAQRADESATSAAQAAAAGEGAKEG